MIVALRVRINSSRVVILIVRISIMLCIFLRISSIELVRDIYSESFEIRIDSMVTVRVLIYLVCSVILISISDLWRLSWDLNLESHSVCSLYRLSAAVLSKLSISFLCLSSYCFMVVVHTCFSSLCCFWSALSSAAQASLVSLSSAAWLIFVDFIS